MLNTNVFPGAKPKRRIDPKSGLNRFLNTDVSPGAKPNRRIDPTSKKNTLHPASWFGFSPRRRVIWKKSRVSLRLVDLSWIPIGTFFRELNPASEVATFLSNEKWPNLTFNSITPPDAA